MQVFERKNVCISVNTYISCSSSVKNKLFFIKKVVKFIIFLYLCTHEKSYSTFYMNEYLTILTTGALLALFGLFTAFFWFSPNNGQHKRSLFRITAIFYGVLLLWNLIYVGVMLFLPHLLTNWQLLLAFNIPLFPFITFIILEMLYPDKHVDRKTMLQHLLLPFTLLAAYLLAYNLVPAAAVWLLGLLCVWGIVYVAVMLPMGIISVRRYEIMVREIFVDSEGHSIAWLARLSGTLFAFYVLYCFFSLSNISFFTAWLFNVFEFVVYMVLGLQISRMRRNDPIHIDQPGAETEEINGDSIADGANVEANDSEAAKLVADLETWLMKDNRLSSNDLNREMVARAMGTNHITLARLLREQTGMSLAQFVTDLRLREAERLLLDRDMTIEEVCYQVGYQTRSTFTRAFRERNHCTATEWRDAHRKENNESK